MPDLITPRLILRPWRDADRAPLAAITGDPHTMRFFAAVRTPAQSDAWMDRTQAHIDRNGFGIWAAELPGTGLIGFVGLSTIPPHLPVTRGVELVWTLGATWWGHGYAPEAALAAAADGFARLDLHRTPRLHRRRERPLATGDGENRHAARSAGEFRPSRYCCRAYISAACCVPAC